MVRVERGGRSCGRGDDDEKSSIISSGSKHAGLRGDGACRGPRLVEAVEAAVAMKTTAAAATLATASQV